MKELVFFLIVLLHISANGQEGSEFADERPVHVDLGVGLPLILPSIRSDFNENLENAGLQNLNTVIGVYWSVDGRILPKFRIGVSAAYNVFSFKDNFINPHDLNMLFYGDTVIALEKVDLIQITASIKATYVLHEDDRFFVYTGIMAGYSFWDDSPPLGYVNVGSQYSKPNGSFSLLAIGGMRWFFVQNIGVYTEVGVGSGPFIVNAGLSWRMSMKQLIRTMAYR